MIKLTSEENLHKEMTSKEKYGDQPQRMNFERANQYLQELKKVFNKVGIRFFLFCGTLVGAIRDNDFPWLDGDVDVGLFYEDADKFLEMGPLFKELGYYVCYQSRVLQTPIAVEEKDKSGKVEGRYMNGYIAKREFRDKVDFHTLALFKNQRCVYRYPRDGFDFYIPYPKKYFENLKEIEFKGEKYLVPNPPEEFLECMWGDWKVPHGGQWGIIPAQKVPKGAFKHEVVR